MGSTAWQTGTTARGRLARLKALEPGPILPHVVNDVQLNAIMHISLGQTSDRPNFPSLEPSALGVLSCGTTPVLNVLKTRLHHPSRPPHSSHERGRARSRISNPALLAAIHREFPTRQRFSALRIFRLPRSKPLFRGLERPNFSRIAILTVPYLVTYPAFYVLSFVAKDRSFPRRDSPPSCGVLREDSPSDTPHRRSEGSTSRQRVSLHNLGIETF